MLKRKVTMRTGWISHAGIACALLALACGIIALKRWHRPARVHAQTAMASIPRGESSEQAQRQSSGCVSCHTTTDAASMHPQSTVVIGCADCHGGDPTIVATGQPGTVEYTEAKRKAHIQPRFREDAARGGHPKEVYSRWLKESQEYIRFVNPGDLRVAEQTCGSCHAQEVMNVRNSMMTHGAMLWGAVLYNNGAFPYKNPHFGESYSADGTPQRLRTFPPPTPEETKTKGVLPYLDPLQRWEISQPGNVLRAFERGGEKKPELGIPDPDEDSGAPDEKLSNRGFGTQLRTDPVFLGLQKTRLLDPLLSFPGTNEQPGDYRGSGCTGCHVIYANDRDPEHSDFYAKYGHDGTSVSTDPAVSKTESGHPLRHIFTKSIPSSQCMVCHVHPGTNMVTTYFGYTWWDNEADGDSMYPKKQKNPTQRQYHDTRVRDPEDSASKGNWSDVEFLKQVGAPEFNKNLKETQFADFHSHGWIFRAVFKRDREGYLLDADGTRISDEDPNKLAKSVHLEDIHLQQGMHCVDCHFLQDAHGNGKLYGETRNAIEIGCEDCHGTISHKATLITSGSAAAGDASSNLARYRTPFGDQRFYWRDGRLYQRSNLEKDKEWEVVQVLDTITPGNPHYSEKSRYAKTIQKDGVSWGGSLDDLSHLAHNDKSMTCYACHTSWTTSCFGCHLSMTANQRMPMLHNEGLMTRNWTAYNFHVLRDDVYMLGIDGTVTGNRIAPVRSACAVVVSSQNANRDWIYQTQQTVSAPGFSGEAFSTYVPHTVRAKETKQCTDCHVSADKDNNAWMAQVLVQGTNFLNFMGKYIYVAAGRSGFEAVPVVESQEPPAIRGSDLDAMAYPDNYSKFVKDGRLLRTAYEHRGDEVQDVQLRGEYLYAALGHAGIRIYDVANVDVKDVSERVITAPVSPLGQRFYLKTKDAAAIASPSTLALDPLRTQIPENEEQSIAPLYAFLYVADREEGLVVVGDPKKGVGTLLDGDPQNNFLKRALAFNPDGKLTGAHRIAIAGTYAYMLCNAGLEVVDLHDPLHPQIVSEIGAPILDHPTGVGIQFRYAFITDSTGLKIFDVTHLDHPEPVANAQVAIGDARNVYVARTYAYVSAGKNGIAFVNVEQPEHPHLTQTFNANGVLNDVNDVKIGMVSSEQFAFVADGRNGLRVIEIFGPKTQSHFYGFSPRPEPKLIATRKTSGPALVVSKGVDRDRAVDESGNQLAVFGRRGARPFTLEEMQRLYLHDGKLYTVTDTPPGPAADMQRASGGQTK